MSDLPKPILYLAGPITGVDDYERLFMQADEVLRFTGYETRNPTKYTGLRTPLAKARPYSRFTPGRRPPEPSWHDYMRQAIRVLARVDGVALLDGWADSRGATWEHRIATEVLALPCLPVCDWLELGGLMP